MLAGRMPQAMRLAGAQETCSGGFEVQEGYQVRPIWRCGSVARL